MTISQIKKVSWFLGLVLILLTLLGSSMTVLAAVPAGSEFPSNWSITSSTTAVGTNASGVSVTVTLTGNLIFLRRDNLMGVDGGTAPSYFPTTTTHALIIQIPNNGVCSGNAFTGCGTVTYSFSDPVMTPILYIASLGKGQGGTTWSGFNDAPWTLPSGMTFSLESTGSQTDTATLDMAIQNTNRSVGINNVASIPGTTIPPSGSCTKFGCGAYLVNGAGSFSSLTFSLGYRGTAGTGQGNDNFAVVFGTTPTPDLAITKSSNGPWAIGQSGAVYTLSTANNGLFATAGTVTVRDVLPTGITPQWTGTRTVTSNGITWACTFSGQNVTCTTSNSIAVSETSDITLPVNIGTTAAASSTNYASIGGGGDAFNSGTAPTAGVTCTDATHCASNTTTITSGTIIITKDAVPNNAQNFSFTGSGSIGTFSLDDDSDATLPNTRTFSSLAPGTYTVTETAVAGWGLTNLVCTDPTGNTTVNLGTRQATIDVAAGETVSCTYTNTQNPADLSISKTNGQTSYYPGQWFSYAITVTNNGPTAANNSVFRDAAVSGFVVSNVSCSASGGAVCPTIDATNYTTQIAAMQGAGLAIPTFPSGGSVTFMVSGAVNANMSGSLTNTATVTAPSGVNDYNSANNSASDTDSQDFTSPLPVCSNGADYVEWTGTFASGSGSVDSTVTLIPYLPNLTYTTTGGGSITLNTAESMTATGGTDNTWVNIFGSPNAGETTRWHLSLGAFAAPTVQTITFASDAPANQWGFLIADLDVEQIKIEAFDGSGNQYSDAEVHTWYRGVYDADTIDGVNLPRWIGPTNPWAMGSGVGGDPPNIPPGTPFVAANSGADDTSRSSIWFAPDMPVRTLRITYQNIAAGSDRLYVASCLRPTTDLTIAKSHTGNFTIGSPGTYNFTVSNAGSIASSGAVTVSDTLPTGLTVNGGAAGSVTSSGTNGADWTCNSDALTPQTVTCTSSTAIAGGGSSSFGITVNVGANTAIGTNSITNTATVSGGNDSVTTNNSASDPTTVVLPTFSCGSTMFGSNGSSLYTINTATAVTTQVGVLAASTSAIAVQPSTGNVYYYDTNTAAQLYVWNATTGVSTSLGGTFTITNSGGGMLRLAFSPTGRLFAADQGGSGTVKLYEINPTTGAVISSGVITFSTGGSGSGDMVFDSYGTLFYSAGSGLYTVNITTRFATLVSTMTASPMTGLAFSGTGTLYGGNSSGGSQTFYSINANTGTATLIGSTGGGPSDLGSCAFPTPVLASTKTVAKVAGSSGVTVSPGDTLEYTITTTNSGNVPATGTTLTDAIPTGTTYVASSTKLNGTAVADVSGAMPYTTAREIHGVGMNAGVIGSDAGVNNVATVVFRVTVNTSSPPTSVSNQGTINFNNGTPVLTDDPNVGGTTDPTVTTITPIPPNVELLKSCSAPADCTTISQNPGTDVTYNIAFTNSGGTDAQNMIITDAIPTNTDFKLGTASSSLGTTGLTVVIEYSNDYDALNPTLATWTYTPVSGGGGADAGYDRLVKAVRWRATAGVLSNIAPNNTGSVSFGVKIR